MVEALEYLEQAAAESGYRAEALFGLAGTARYEAAIRAIDAAIADALTISERAQERVKTLFQAIAHGDEVHRDWLKEAIDAHFAGKLVPQPRAAVAVAISEERLEVAARASFEAVGQHDFMKWDSPWVTEPEPGEDSCLRDVYIKAARAVVEALGFTVGVPDAKS